VLDVTVVDRTGSLRREKPSEFNPGWISTVTTPTGSVTTLIGSADAGLKNREVAAIAATAVRTGASVFISGLCGSSSMRGKCES
jgi:hypothetical protein